MAISGVLAHNYGWPSIFYVFGKNVFILLALPYIFRPLICVFGLFDTEFGKFVRYFSKLEMFLMEKWFWTFLFGCHIFVRNGTLHKITRFFWLSNMEDTLVEKFTRCAKVYGLFLLDCAFRMLIGWDPIIWISYEYQYQYYVPYTTSFPTVVDIIGLVKKRRTPFHFPIENYYWPGLSNRKTSFSQSFDALSGTNRKFLLAGFIQ